MTRGVYVGQRDRVKLVEFQNHVADSWIGSEIL